LLFSKGLNIPLYSFELTDEGLSLFRLYGLLRKELTLFSTEFFKDYSLIIAIYPLGGKKLGFYLTLNYVPGNSKPLFA
jgi:hypothetical protein